MTINLTQKLDFTVGRAENMEKGENASYCHFLFFPQCCQKVSFLRSLKVGIVWKRGKEKVLLRIVNIVLKGENDGNQHFLLFSSTGRRPASYCHDVVSVVRQSVCLSVHACVRKPFLQKTSPQKLLTGFLRNFTGMFLRWSSFKFLQIIVFYEEFWLPWRSK